jgi:RecA/RadA recombinase
MSNGAGVHPDFDGSIITPSAGTIHRFADIPNLQTMEIPSIDYLVPGLIARQTITLWTGPDGTAKSFVALKMAVAVASGRQSCIWITKTPPSRFAIASI